ncbi:unnamed protein product [Peniophora sp. CBMAI 1063]|nr:unnamed protein product [Peniophora sp. CBMAI 1063]
MQSNPVVSFYTQDPTATFARQTFGRAGAAKLWSRILQDGDTDNRKVRALVRGTRPHEIAHSSVKIRIDGCPPPPCAAQDGYAWIMDYACDCIGNQAERIVRQKLFVIHSAASKPTGEDNARYKGIPAPFFFLRKGDPYGWTVGISLQELDDGKISTVLADMEKPYAQGMFMDSCSRAATAVFPWKGRWHEHRYQPKDPRRALTNREFVVNAAHAIEHIWKTLGIPISPSARASVKLIGVFYVSKGRYQAILEAPLTERLHEHSSW